jgi:hypothetical protein
MDIVVLAWQRGVPFHLQSCTVLAWQRDKVSTVVRKNSTENDECVAPLLTAVRGRYSKTSTQPIEQSKTQHVASFRLDFRADELFSGTN